MGSNTEIAWTTHTFNPWWGCEKISAGCKHCYADTFAKRVGHGKRLPTIWGGADTERKIASEKVWRDPVKWNAEACDGERVLVFCASMADVFEDRLDLVAPRARLFRLIESTPFLTWQLLTKRPENMIRLARDAGWTGAWWPKNVWAGTTAEDQEAYDRRWPKLAYVPARVCFVSYEPAIGPLDPAPYCGLVPDWLIIGGESGPGARPFDLAWARLALEACRDREIAPFVKQLGARPIYQETTGVAAPRMLPWVVDDAKGGDLAEWPPLLRVREFPRVST